MSDVVLVTILMVLVVIGTSIFWIIYGTHRVTDLRLEHAKHIERIHSDYDMQRRIYGSVPIEKLVGYEKGRNDA